MISTELLPSDEVIFKVFDSVNMAIPEFYFDGKAQHHAVDIWQNNFKPAWKNTYTELMIKKLHSLNQKSYSLIC